VLVAYRWWKPKLRPQSVRLEFETNGYSIVVQMNSRRIEQMFGFPSRAPDQGELDLSVNWL
jgi:hypothetical protein